MFLSVPRIAAFRSASNHPCQFLNATTTTKATAATTSKGGSAPGVVLDVVHGGSLRLALLVRVGDNLHGQGQIAAQVLNALVRQVAVVVLPVEGDADKAAGFERLHQHEHFEVGGSLDCSSSA